MSQSVLSSARELGIKLVDLNTMTVKDFSKIWRKIASEHHPDNHLNLSKEEIVLQQEIFDKKNEAKQVIENFLQKDKRNCNKRERFIDSIAGVEPESKKQKADEEDKLIYGYFECWLTKEQVKKDMKDYPITISYDRVCVECNGKTASEEKCSECKYCEGQGRVFFELDDVGEVNGQCPVCKGHKVVPKHVIDLCKTCNGTGVEIIEKKEKVSIPSTSMDRAVLKKLELKDGMEKIFKEVFIILRFQKGQKS